MPNSLLAQFNMPFAPEQASEFSKPYDQLYWATTALTVFFTAVVVAMLFVFCVRYRHGNKVNRANAPTSHMLLEMTWTVIPFILAMLMFFWAAHLFVQQRIPPKDSQEIYVIGKQWMWHVQHPNGVREMNELHVPIGKNVKLVMISQDVIHSFFIPAFRIKQDVIPGRYTMQWFKAIKTGKYPIFCAEYCGTSHSEMGGYVYVMSQADFDKWLANGGETVKTVEGTPVEQGKVLWDRYRCATCHGPTDNEHGPSLYNLLGKTRKFTDGSSAVADREYIRESIVEPGKHILQGYQDTMASYKGDITEDQLLMLYEYVRSLGFPAEKPAPKTGSDPATALATSKRGNKT